jgi:uncharacterized protein YbjT (DUF2867 family)
MPSQAVIAGATGLVGQECLRRLLDCYDSVIAVVRRSTGLTHPKLTERVLDFDRLEMLEITRGSHVFCSLGTTIKKAGSQAAFRKVDFEYPKALAERAAAARDTRFMLVSSIGADAYSGNFYLHVKGELEDAVRAMPFDAVHIFRPSLMLGDRSERRFAETAALVSARVLAPLLVGPLRKYRPIPASRVAAAMVTAANRDARGTFVYHYDEMIQV